MLDLRSTTFSLFLILGAQPCAAGLGEIDQLIQAKQYQTAFDALQELDPADDDPVVFATKVEIATRYYAVCLGEELFGLRDLAEEEEIADIRGDQGTYKMYRLDIEGKGWKLVASFPEDGRLGKVLGDWYYNNRDSSDAATDRRERARACYEQAAALGVADFEALHNLGVLLLEQEKPREAVAALERSLRLKDGHASTHYNMAYAQQQLSNAQETAAHAAKAFALYQDEQLKSEAALLAAYGFWDNHDRAAALDFAEKADRHKHENYYYILTKLMSLYLEMKEAEKAAMIADQLFALERGNPRLVQDVMAAYDQASERQGLESFFARNLETAKDEPHVCGNLLFHRADHWKQHGENDRARADLLKARAQFESTIDGNPEALAAIAARLAELNAR